MHNVFEASTRCEANPGYERSSNSELGVVADGARWLRAMLRKCACVSQSISINFVLLFIITIDIS